jgi:pimeloyl-ACP methyl ester carboxylesterase
MRLIICAIVTLLSSCSYQSLEDLAYVDTLKKDKTFWDWEDQKIHYVEKGTGDRHVVLLHGFGAGTVTWNQQIECLSEEGYHVWAVDFLGFGFSDKPLNIKYTPDLYCEQIDAFLAAKGIEKTHIIGNSMGGAIALSFAAIHPDKVVSMVLLDPLAYPIKLPLPYAIGKKFGRLVAPFLTRSAVERTLKSIYYDPNKISQDLVDSYFLPYFTEGGKEAPLLILRSFDDEMLHRLRPFYSTIQAPVLLIWGREDSWIPVEHMARLSSELANTEQKVILFCGHTPQEERPEEVNQLLKENLSRFY